MQQKGHVFRGITTIKMSVTDFVNNVIKTNVFITEQVVEQFTNRPRNWERYQYEETRDEDCVRADRESFPVKKNALRTYAQKEK